MRSGLISRQGKKPSKIFNATAGIRPYIGPYSHQPVAWCIGHRPQLSVMAIFSNLHRRDEWIPIDSCIHDRWPESICISYRKSPLAGINRRSHTAFGIFIYRALIGFPSVALVLLIFSTGVFWILIRLLLKFSSIALRLLICCSCASYI